MEWQRAVPGLLLAAGLAACGDVPTSAPMTAAPSYAVDRAATISEAVTGVVEGGTFSGTIRIREFGLENGELVVSGVLSGVATVGGVATEVTDQAFTTGADLTASGPSCRILFLDVGPIFLDLLGLQVDLSQIVLDVTAVPGAGNLLGNLLCAVVRLLDGPGALAGLLNLLDRINDLLG